MSRRPRTDQHASVFDPDLLSRCISCGFCLPACPTYALTGDEASSPRGRITLMRALESGELGSDDTSLREQSSFCLGCRACEPVCPAGVQYGQLLEQWRDHQWRGRRMPMIVRLLTLAVTRSRWLRLAGTLRRAADSARADGPHLMLGCAERVLFPKVSRAARSVDPTLRVVSDQGCCGALHAHNGGTTGGQRLARELGERLNGRIVTTSGGCAAHLATVLGRDRVMDLSQYLAGRDFPPLLIDGRKARVGLQDSCHLRNGLGVWQQPRALLRAVAEYVELPGAATCCGAAGTYSLLRRRDSAAVLRPKLDAIEAANLDYLVVVNPGCQRQLIHGLRRRRSPARVLHLAELLALTVSGPGQAISTGHLGHRARSGGRLV